MANLPLINSAKWEKLLHCNANEVKTKGSIYSCNDNCLKAVTNEIGRRSKRTYTSYTYIDTHYLQRDALLHHAPQHMYRYHRLNFYYRFPGLLIRFRAQISFCVAWNSFKSRPGFEAPYNWHRADLFAKLSRDVVREIMMMQRCISRYDPKE